MNSARKLPFCEQLLLTSVTETMRWTETRSTMWMGSGGSNKNEDRTWTEHKKDAFCHLVPSERWIICRRRVFGKSVDATWQELSREQSTVTEKGVYLSPPKRCTGSHHKNHALCGMIPSTASLSQPQGLLVAMAASLWGLTGAAISLSPWSLQGFSSVWKGSHILISPRPKQQVSAVLQLRKLLLH